MSCEKGNTSKRNGQKYKNTIGFKADKWGQTTKLLKMQAVTVGAVCKRCADKIEWRKKFAKYKPLTKPARCEKCLEKSVKYAYHKVCLNCAKTLGICAMCRTSGDVLPMPKNAEEREKKRVEEEQALKAMSERNRRTFLRKQKIAEKEAKDALKGDDGEGGDVDCEEGEASNADDGISAGTRAMRLDGSVFESRGEAAPEDKGAPREAPADNDWENEMSDDSADG